MDDISAIVPPLLQWFRAGQRALPWREEPSPYRVWISEIMLQQTRVKAATPYFLRFVQALPSIEALAEASDEQLLKLWEGLGYYSRVRNLKKAAQILVREHGGQLPKTMKELQKLPGIGPYTAGAIAAIAYGLPEPAVDGNVLRVVSRVCASRLAVDTAEGKLAVEAAVRAAIPQKDPSAFAQGLMELGALVCLPGEHALCSACPLAFTCRAAAEGVPEKYPLKQKRPARRVEQRTVFVLIADNTVLLQKRPPHGLLAGLWQFPSAGGALSRGDALLQLREWGISPIILLPLAPYKHIFTHVEWHLQGYLARIEGAPAPLLPAHTFASFYEVEHKLAIPSAFAPYTEAAKQALL